MADFTNYFGTLLKNEGNYCDVPGDSGHETYRGIARGYNGQWSGWSTIDTVKRELGLVSPVPRAHWQELNRRLGPNAKLNDNIRQFYKHLYWDSLHLDQVESQSIAEQLADHGVNAGTMRPAKMLQYLLNTQFGLHLAVDGKLGPKTIEALNDVDPYLFYLSLVEMRNAFYYYLAGSPLTSTPHLAAWSPFLRNSLKVRPNPANKKFLRSWLSRTKAPFVS